MTINWDKWEAKDAKARSDAAVIPPSSYGPSLTVQSQAEDADINVLMKRYGLTGKMPDAVCVPRYEDFSNVLDFRTASDAIVQANQDFMLLPADVRSRFDNNPQKLLEAVYDPVRRDELRAIFGSKAQLPEITPASVAGAPAVAPVST